MAKILIALDGDNSFNKNLFDISNKLFSDLGEHLFVGLIVKDFSYVTSLSNYMGEPVLADFLPNGSSLLSEEDQVKTEMISRFEEHARDFDVKYEIHNNFRMTVAEMVQQTTYADLLLLSYKVFYNHITKTPDTTLLYQVLKGSKCPVMILPENMGELDNLIFTYDGKESSVFAIRAFSSLFGPTTRDKIVSILTVMPNADEEIKNEKLLLNLVKQHYKNVGIQLLEGKNISMEISNFARNVQNPVVVMGAYGRSYISNLLLPSVAKNILKKSILPMFIAHP